MFGNKDGHRDKTKGNTRNRDGHSDENSNGDGNRDGHRDGNRGGIEWKLEKNIVNPKELQ